MNKESRLMKQGSFILFLALIVSFCFVGYGASDHPAGLSETTVSSRASSPPSGTRNDAAVINLVPERGGRVDWSHSNGLIAHCRYGADGYFDLWTMEQDGSNAHCLTSGKTGIPQLHNGQPAWHPNGRWIAFQSQNPAYRHNKWEDYHITEPGHGMNNDLWVTDPEGKRFFRLRAVAERGWLLHAHFSHDGRRLAWTEKVGTNVIDWAIMIADFVEEPEPHIENVKQYQPAGRVWYEVHEFSADDSKLLLTIGTAVYTGYDIWEYGLATGKLIRLTNAPEEWDEHAHYSPDGSRIVWVSSRGYAYDPKRYGRTLRTDLWIMNADGSHRRRVTYFNEAGYEEHDGQHYIMADNTWSPDGRFAAALVIPAGKGRETARIVRIDIEKALAR